MNETALIEDKPKQRVFDPLPTTQYHVGDPIPNTLSCSDMMRVLNLKAPTFYLLQKAGRMKRFEFRNPINRKKRYSGKKVALYLNEKR